MTKPGYSAFCPLSRASEIIEPRWTLLILSEMWAGSTRFNDIARGCPGLSPSLLSHRLKALEAQGMVRRDETQAGRRAYRTTPMADRLEPIVHALGAWAHENVETAVAPNACDARLLMWSIRRKIDTAAFPDRRTVVQFVFPDLRGAARDYWLVARRDGEADLCMVDPGFAVDLYVEAELAVLTQVYMGAASLRGAIAGGRVYLSGDEALAGAIDAWLRLSSYAAKSEKPPSTAPRSATAARTSGEVRASSSSA